MNAKLKLYAVAFFVAGLSMSLLYMDPNLPKKCQFYVQHYAQKVCGFVGSFFCRPDEIQITETDTGEILFTQEELKKYDGSPDSLGLYVALLGKVYDVEKGAQHYKPGGGYSFFAGRDASKAYVTGDFTEEGLTDDITDFTDDLVYSLVEWHGFYDKEYVYVGKVIGRYFDKYGKATENIAKVQEAVERVKAAKQKMEDEKQIFPPCNSEWEHAKGGRVWCSESSGGVERTWKGVPRQYFRPGESNAKCVCVRTTGPPSVPIEGITDTESDRGDLDNPNMKEYDDCSADAESCNIQ